MHGLANESVITVSAGVAFQIETGFKITEEVLPEIKASQIKSDFRNQKRWMLQPRNLVKSM
jgi:hypothetical protein